MRLRPSLVALALVACGGGATPQLLTTVTPAPSTSASTPPSTASTSTIADAESPDASTSVEPPASATASASASAPTPPSAWESLTLVERCPKPPPRENHPARRPVPCGPNRMCGSRAQVLPLIRDTSCRFGGPLPHEVIRRITRQNYGRLRLCYENAVRSDPRAEGTVAVVIDIRPNGAVDGTAIAGGSLNDAAAAACIARGFGDLSFPQADGPTRAVLTLDFYVP